MRELRFGERPEGARDGKAPSRTSPTGTRGPEMPQRCYALEAVGQRRSGGRWCGRLGGLRAPDVGGCISGRGRSHSALRYFRASRRPSGSTRLRVGRGARTTTSWRPRSGLPGFRHGAFSAQARASCLPSRLRLPNSLLVAGQTQASHLCAYHRLPSGRRVAPMRPRPMQLSLESSLLRLAAVWNDQRPAARTACAFSELAF